MGPKTCGDFRSRDLVFNLQNALGYEQTSYLGSPFDGGVVSPQSGARCHQRSSSPALDHRHHFGGIVAGRQIERKQVTDLQRIRDFTPLARSLQDPGPYGLLG